MSSVTGQAQGEHALLSEVGATEGGDHVWLRKAPLTSTLVTRACAYGLRRIARCTMPGRLRLSVHLGLAGDEAGILLAQPGPADLRLVDGRGHAPTSAGLAGTASGAALAPAPPFAAACTARTMF
jgi:hypothetical protein